jgi:hypothetical protein
LADNKIFEVQVHMMKLLHRLRKTLQTRNSWGNKKSDYNSCRNLYEGRIYNEVPISPRTATLHLDMSDS